MENKAHIAIVLLVVLFLSTIALAQGPGTPPSAPPEPSPPAMDNENKPLKERLEAFYMEKEKYINQKRQCKEYAVTANVEKGYCWDKLKPLMLGMLLKEVALTEKRLVQLQDRNIIFPDHDEITAKLTEAKAIFTDNESSKELIKSTAKKVEEIINYIEEKATWNNASLLITQMDNLMAKADALVLKLEAKLDVLKTAGNDSDELEAALEQFKADLVKTRENIANAKAKYGQMESSGEISQLAKEVRTFINDAKKNLEKAFDRAKKIVPAMDKSEKGGNVEDSDLSMNDTGDGAE